MKYLTQTLKGSDLIFDEVINATPSTAVAPESFDIATSAVIVYSGREPEPNGSPRSAIKIHRIEILPEWTYSYQTGDSNFFFNVEAIPFIRTHGVARKTTGNGPGTVQNIVFSSNTNAEWELNAFSGATQGVPNDRIYTDPFIIHPYESLFIRLYNASKLTGGLSYWTNFIADEKVATVRISYEDYDPNERYYGRPTTNDVFLPPTATERPEFSASDQERGYAELMVLDLYADSNILQEEPFVALTDDNYFEMDSLSFRSGYPFGGWTDSGVNASNYMYDIMVRTENIPTSLVTLRKWMSYTAGNTTAVLDYRELLKGPTRIKKGQQLFVRIYTQGAALGGDTNNQYYYRQAPAFWFNGTVPK